MWNAHIHRKDMLRRRVVLYIYDDHGDGTYTALDADGVQHHGDWQLSTETDVPGIELPVNALPAILAALSHELGAVEHPLQLRKDYEDERARVNKLTDTIIRIVERQ